MIALGIGDTGVEPDLMVKPTLSRTDDRSESGRIVVGMVVAKRVLGVPEEILAVKERDSALGNRFFRHDPVRGRSNPTGAPRGKSGRELLGRS